MGAGFRGSRRSGRRGGQEVLPAARSCPGPAYLTLVCGILALASSREPLCPNRLGPALASLRHRGPDATGTWIAPDRRVGLGHTRLAIVDLETGDQPIASEDGRMVAVVNGEFYGWERMRRDLEQRGHRFRTRSDSELLVHLYEEYGTGCLSYLRGEFAFALWDAAAGRLFAARDRWGIKPLCYAEWNGAFALASEAKALFALGAPAAWDPQAFLQAVQVQYTPPDRTLFAGIRQLPPGHFLTRERGELRTAVYWDLNYPLAEPPAPLSERRRLDAIQELRERLNEAVCLRLRADVPVACHVSGGLDSSVILGLAARHSARPVDCFTVRFDAAPYDEWEVAAETARAAGAVLHGVRATPEALVHCLPDAVYAAEGLAINGHLPAKFLLSRAIRDAGYKVVLTGEGSDEVLAGYAHLRRDLLETGGGGAAAGGEETSLAERNRISAGIMLPEGEGLSLAGVRRRLGWAPTFLQAKATLGRRLRDVLAEPFLQEWGGVDSLELFVSAITPPGSLSGRGPVDQALYLWNKSALANYILRTLGDGTEMAHSVEGRLPFL
ncbi:MAG: asparagine synthase (glutamine-hydrolyzing), partial [SAR202 cluster bacterium]|nr:asparagine synthase (glutamine-hydrolyzing) [SAR202 cluster bacterium]